MADALEPLLKKIRIAFGKKLGMPSYQEVNAQDFPAQIDRIPTIADGSIPKYQGPFMVTPGPNAQTIQTEGKYSEANITVAPAPPSGVEIKTWEPTKNDEILRSDKYIIPLKIEFILLHGALNVSQLTGIYGPTIIHNFDNVTLIGVHFNFGWSFFTSTNIENKTYDLYVIKKGNIELNNQNIPFKKEVKASMPYDNKVLFKLYYYEVD